MKRMGRKKYLMSIRSAMKIKDGLLSELIKIKLISLLTKWNVRHSDQVESESRFKALTRRIFNLVKANTKDSIAQAILLLKGPKAFFLFLSGIGSIPLILLTTLLRKLFGALSINR